MKQILPFLLLLVLSMCCDMHDDDLIGSELINKHFTKSDRAELAKIFSFVDSAVLSKVENKNIPKA